MAAHFLNLLSRAFQSIPTSLGSNWLGLIFPLIAFLLTQAITGLIKGWQHLKLHVKDTLLLGFIVAALSWSGLFLWCILTTVYGDHEGLVKQILALGKERRESIERSESAQKKFAADTSHLNRQIQALSTKCAVQEGISQTLQSQNRDQQSTINGCLSQAIRLLSPPVLKVTTFYLGTLSRPNNQVQPRFFSGSWLLITNELKTPVKIIIECDAPIISADADILSETGGSTESISQGSISANRYRINIESPAWVPSTPILATARFGQPQIKGCSFSVE